MATEIRVPTLGESVSEATIGKWFKKAGDVIVVDEPLVELETDKVTIEVPAPSAGVLVELTVKEGETVGVGALLGTIGAGDGAVAAAKPAAVAQASASSVKEAVAQTASIAGSPPIEERKMPPAPAAAKLLAETNLSVDQVAGSGKRGQVLKGDVLDAITKGISAPAAAPVAAPVVARVPSSVSDAPREERVRMTKLRQTIARRLKEAQSTAAMLTTFNEVDMSAVMALRTKYKDVFEKKHGVKLGFMGFFTKAVTHALKEIPAVNAEIDGTDIIYKNFAHVGVAVGTEKGLVVPVVRDADQMSIAEIEKEIGRLGLAARDGKLSVADMQGGTFTISNGGVYGSLMSTPILNAPQSGILGMHKIQDRPVVVGGQIVIRPMMYLALSYDHRIVDGKEAVTFLVRVKDSLEDPERLVLDL
ncbi:2-oxoglutarate dehydrogenase complex dihydrolipoyllysine-residue succinyltransferase [Aminobacter carboxidus]|uniref:Dihydrolipoyllysine-residue succinyltransferase component of 2-oxoglutarate dehydrogenase complex n=1 Tax=Aminobacter carboxidus TaxID=376165 RepID=A0A8E1WD07_9HYPH|nr:MULTISPECIES: 2-oxoglutarate dehydrogenase complex dihydrolipoyllysine-residue succinyltransferase [Aminobacter carboxidus group]MBB6465763.1 2-oxoglutarate dehydrogenase E2 component (dihydrolipoamide succinyltransferase) [Aminobacter lissarensis]MBE1204498.1 2-oxoglutarate dehydrogenase complex dihydrolipoyllysine-residue succinyltransferase [Aminobacter carboxidus]